MCICPTEWILSHNLQFSLQKRPKRSRVRIHNLARRKQCKEKIDTDMELKNLKLYMENISIIEENEKLRKQATLLHQENLALMSEFQTRFSKHDPINNDKSRNTMH
ncbi:protein binding [Abeliophyllum distichum]|uniref:Protein binding n=1 Tax=Abeliophyllum distichum TaxID=126358 RepID=A0ABD1TW37_9LAMI